MAVDTWQASAPGKVILFGEHAVVHGHVALAASVDLRTTATLQCASHLTTPELKDTHLSLHIPSFGIHCHWLPSDLSNAVRETEGESSLEVLPRRVHGCSDKLLSRLRFMAEGQIPTSSLSSMTGGVTAFLFLYCRLLGSSPADVSVTTELPVGAGLGSSAAFCVAVSSVLLAKAGIIGKDSLESLESLESFESLEKNNETKGSSELESKGAKGTRDWKRLSKEDLALVNSWAYEGEKILHGNPSGVDNSVSTYGHMLRFQNGSMEHLQPQSPLRILLTDTCVPRNTKALVKAVRDRLSRHPRAMGAILSSMHEIAFEAFSLLQCDVRECTNSRSETIIKEEKTGSDIPECTVLGIEGEKVIDGVRVENGVKSSSSFEKANDGRHRSINHEPVNENETDISENEASLGSLSMSESVSGRGRVEPVSGIEESCHPRTDKSSEDTYQSVIGPQERLEEMVRMSQGLLDAIGVGHPAISAVCRVTASHGLQSKLTGAGGGGCVLTLLPPHLAPEKVENLKTELEGLGCVSFDVVVGGGGVSIYTV